SALILLSLSFFFIQNFRIDASSDTLVAQNDEEFKYFNFYNKIFISENFLVLAVEKKGGIDLNFIDNFEKISSKLVKLEPVSHVFSFIDAPILFLNNTSLTNLRSDNIENIKNTDLKINDVIEEFSNNPVYKDQLLNQDADVFSIVVYLNKNAELISAQEDFKNSIITKKKYLKIKKLHDEKRNNLIKNIRKIINEADKKHSYYLGGVEMIANDVINFVKKDIIIFSISVVLIIIGVLFFIFREIKWVIISLLTSSYAIIVIFGILGLSQIEVTAISSNFSALIFILSISMNIHIINYYRLLDYNKNNLSVTLKNMFWPCLYTTLTTMVAFGSLIITDIKPIIDFGFIMLISLIISLVCSFTILPLCILLFSVNTNYKTNKAVLKINFISLVSLHSKKIIVLSFFLFIISIYGAFNLGVENSFVNYFKKNTEIYKGMKLIDEELGGTTPLDVILTFNSSDELLISIDDEEESIDDSEFEDEFLDEDIFSSDTSDIWFTEDKIEMISIVHRYLESKNEVGKVQSIISLIELADLINKVPLNTFELSVLYNEIPETYKQDLIYPYLVIDENMAKITARIKDSEDINRKNIINDIKNFIDNNKNSTLEDYKVNGLLVLYNNMLDSLFESQIKSLGFVIILIFLMFLILFQSIKLSILAIIPNIFASSFILGIIGFLSIPLDIMTITIAAITIGIAVDNTIHYLYRFKEFNKNNNVINAINLTNRSAGLAVFTTSVTIALGFSILSLSSFIPTVIFGIFTSMAMIFAMIGVLILLPSLIILFKK
ncbi:MMPL family transporter, partial [Alphaproteobacteria bacterium]|nr:MMPL family transporter [Alphaproteobacteria bacterium]